MNIWSLQSIYFLLHQILNVWTLIKLVLILLLTTYSVKCTLNLLPLLTILIGKQSLCLILFLLQRRGHLSCKVTIMFVFVLACWCHLVCALFKRPVKVGFEVAVILEESWLDKFLLLIQTCTPFVRRLCQVLFCSFWRCLYPGFNPG